MNDADAQLESRLLALIASAVPRAKTKTGLSRETRLHRDLGLDSIGILALVFRFEEEFGIDLAQTAAHFQIATLRCAGDLIDAAKTILAETQGGLP